MDEILRELRGTITAIYGPPKAELGINIHPDDPKECDTYVDFYRREDEWSQFKVGQRVVLVTYCWKRPIEPSERWEFPDEDCIRSYRYETYDEQTYDNEKEKKKQRQKQKQKRQ